MRADAPVIPAPPFPRELPWVNAATLRMDQQRGRPVLVEFWDFCRVNSLRTLPYIRAWHEKYPRLRVIGVHTGGFPPSRDDDEVRRAVARLGIDWPVAIDTNLQVWDIYGNEGWPARYLWDPEQRLHSLHYGEGAYEETEREIQELLGEPGPLVEPVRPEDVPEALLVAQTDDQPGLYRGPYEAGGVWAVVGGAGTIAVNGEPVTFDAPGCVQLLEHEFSTAGELELSADVEVYATCFTPGLARYTS